MQKFSSNTRIIVGVDHGPFLYRLIRSRNRQTKKAEPRKNTAMTSRCRQAGKESSIKI